VLQVTKIVDASTLEFRLHPGALKMNLVTVRESYSGLPPFASSGRDAGKGIIQPGAIVRFPTKAEREKAQNELDRSGERFVLAGLDTSNLKEKDSFTLHEKVVIKTDSGFELIDWKQLVEQAK